MNWADNIRRKQLCQYVNKKINRSIHHSHVLGVITILFDEMIKDFDLGKQIRIHNLGTFSLQNTKGRRHYNFSTKQVEQSKPHRIMKFGLMKGVHRKLLSLIDVGKTLAARESNEK